jgi:hypothetical protein
VLIVPASASSWITWTLPDTGFGLQISPVLNNPLAWTVPSAFPGIIPMYGMSAQLLGTNDIPAGNTAFFELLKRQFAKLQVLLPGETNAPNTTTGKVGTPTPIPAGTVIDVIVNAVDSTWHIIPGVVDTISLATPTDTGSIIGLPAPMANGTVDIQVQLNTTGSQTVTATDTTNTNIPTATSSPITVQ